VAALGCVELGLRDVLAGHRAHAARRREDRPQRLVELDDGL